MKGILERIGLGSLGVVMFVPFLAGILFAAMLMGAVALFSRSGPPKLTLSYPLVDRQGHERQITITIAGQEQTETPEDASQMARQGELDADLSLFLGPQDWKVLETRVKVRFPLQELLENLMSSGPADVFSLGQRPAAPGGTDSGLGGSLPPELQPLLTELQSKDMTTLLTEANNPELEALMGDNPEGRFQEMTGQTFEQVFMELLQQKPDLVGQLLVRRDYTNLFWEMMSFGSGGTVAGPPVSPR